MARRAPLPLLLPLLLFSGSQAQPKVEKLQKVAGQTLSLRCQYRPKAGPYERKSWCKEVSALVCMKLVTSSSPWKLDGTSRFSIWDNPEAGFFIVTMTGLKEEDSGHYWCKTYKASSNSVSKSKKFYLAVSPGPLTFPEVNSFRPPRRDRSTASSSMQDTWAPGNLVSSQTQNCLSPGPGAPFGTAATPPQGNATLRSDAAAPSALVPVLCGLLVAKSLVLSALLVWALRDRRGQHKWRSLTSPGAQDGWPGSPRTAPRSASLTSEHYGPCKGKAKASQDCIECPWRHPSLQS